MAWCGCLPLNWIADSGAPAAEIAEFTPLSRIETLLNVRRTCGGGERTRTADFYVANVALYQLSYTPEWAASG